MFLLSNHEKPAMKTTVLTLALKKRLAAKIIFVSGFEQAKGRLIYVPCIQNAKKVTDFADHHSCPLKA